MAAIPNFLQGFRLVTGEALNALVTQINNLTGNGTPGAVTATTFSASTSETLAGTLTVTPQFIASAGSTQGGATAITSRKALVTTATASSKGVRLPTAVTGLEVEVGNYGATFATKVYPATNGKIGAAATNATDTVLAVNKVNKYVAVNTTKWIVLRGS